MGYTGESSGRGGGCSGASLAVSLAAEESGGRAVPLAKAPQESPMTSHSLKIKSSLVAAFWVVA